MGNNGQITFVYQFAHASANAATFVPVVGLFAGGATAQSQMVIVSFGADGLVQNVMQTGSNTDIRNGGVPAAIP